MRTFRRENISDIVAQSQVHVWQRKDGLGIDRQRDNAAIDKRRGLTHHIVDEVRRAVTRPCVDFVEAVPLPTFERQRRRL